MKGSKGTKNNGEHDEEEERKLKKFEEEVADELDKNQVIPSDLGKRKE